MSDDARLARSMPKQAKSFHSPEKPAPLRRRRGDARCRLRQALAETRHRLISRSENDYVTGESAFRHSSYQHAIIIDIGCESMFSASGISLRQLAKITQNDGG